MSTSKDTPVRWVRSRLSTWERAMLGVMVLMALSEGLLGVVAANQLVRAFSLVACSGAIVYAACLLLPAGWR